MEYFSKEEFQAAACTGAETELFFSDEDNDYQAITAAKKICKTCPISMRCLEVALVNDEQYGIWGGLTADERNRMRRRSVSRARVKERAKSIPVTVAPKKRTIDESDPRLQQLRERNIAASAEAGKRNAARLAEILEVHGNNLSDDLINLISVRMAYPEASLAELGQRMVPQLTKDQVSGRLRRLMGMGL